MAPNIIPTELSQLNSSLHGRARRSERGIEKIDLQRARRYGMSEQQRNGRIKYTYGGVVFIYCPVSNKEITSFPSPDQTGSSTGTKFSKPILLNKVDCSHDDYKKADLQQYLRNRPEKWTSHSVLVIDMSGSMRRDDINGARCRSDGVFLALARDYIKTPLDKKERSPTDLISIVIMRDEAEVLLEYEPMTNVLYNKVIDLRDWANLRPRGPGNYIPAIEAAEKLLTTNTSAGCALSLLFFSDGRPSDKKGDFTSSIGELAAKFGRRLSLACIGMADSKEDFSVLSSMVSEAKSFGSQASFGRPSLDSESLSHLITSLASSVTSTKTEMTEAASGKCKQVQNVTREKLNTPDLEGAWHIYERKADYRVVSISTWQTEKREYTKLVDPRCSICYAHVGFEVSATQGIVCKLCHSYRLCYNCVKDYNNEDGYLMILHRAKQARSTLSECSANILMIRNGDLTMRRLPTFFIAFKEKIFGEGAERMVRKVRFLDSQGHFTGDPMVAKESRFIGQSLFPYFDDASATVFSFQSLFSLENHGNKQQKDYHVNFMRTQNISAGFAKQFNDSLDNLPGYFKNLNAYSRKLLDDLPRIVFIEPMVVEVNNGSHRQQKYYLIEKLLEGEYKKFNSNNGYICQEARVDNSEDQIDLFGKMINNLNLGAINEGDEDEDSEYESDTDEEDDGLFDPNETAPISGRYNFKDLKSYHIPQAFSHFSFTKSRKKLIVVDLQGVLTLTKERKHAFELTDPVIHRRNKNNRRKENYGRTDRGKKGINDFFRTHKCNEVCRLLGLEEEKVTRNY